ncbi:relaxase/mobilization nuclease domain-containing protein [Lacticaseibacillus paracasei]|uniref:relaxase/mobilization nuclease domain-containing protein n=1 Tax=Lacticaseibacillus paracasei TaxID=1597 RepID=UPI0021A982B8|nr:relaxase/mobilization nuclease domain-containing protein [Lacticaseibacillus paracasei]MCT4393511.1 relaxase [Lacticaseibacillus paracasei]
MATIAKVTNSASAASALDYALGKDKPLHEHTERWLEENRLERLDALKDCRAVAVGGTNGIDPVIAKEQFKAVRQAFNQNKRRNQVLRITQSFANNELNARNPSDWQRANDFGCQLAQQLYPDYQSAVYTHIDGKNHIIHNHIIVNKVNLKTGKKLDERKGTAVERTRQMNDEIAKKQGWQVIAPVREHQSKTEQELTKHGQYSYMHDLRGRIDSTMADTTISDFKTFSAVLAKSGVNVSIRGQNVSYAFLDANHKQRRARGQRLGADYEKEAILHELARRTRDQQEQQLNRDDQSRADSALRETERTDTALEQRERNTTKSSQSLDHLTRATGRTRQTASDLGASYNRQNNRKRRIRDRVTSFANYVRGFTDGLHRFAEQAKQLIADKHLYQDVASRFKADMARKEQNRQAVIKQDLAKRTVPKPQKQQPNQTYPHNRGGLQR